MKVVVELFVQFFEPAVDVSTLSSCEFRGHCRWQQLVQELLRQVSCCDQLRFRQVLHQMFRGDPSEEAVLMSSLTLALHALPRY